MNPGSAITSATRNLRMKCAILMEANVLILIIEEIGRTIAQISTVEIGRTVVLILTRETGENIDQTLIAATTLAGARILTEESAESIGPTSTREIARTAVPISIAATGLGGQDAMASLITLTDARIREAILVSFIARESQNLAARAMTLTSGRITAGPVSAT